MTIRTWLVAALAFACASPALAIDPIGYTAPDGVNTIPVSAANPLPVTGGGGGGGAVTAAANSYATGFSPDLTNLLAYTGAPGSTVCATDTGSCSQNAQLQRLLQRLTTIITNLGSPFQAGGSIGNSGFALTSSIPAGSNTIGAVTINGTPTFNCGTGCGGGSGGAVTGAAGSFVDGWNLTLGSKTDALCTTFSTVSCSQIAIDKAVASYLATISSNNNAVPTYCSSSGASTAAPCITNPWVALGSVLRGSASATTTSAATLLSAPAAGLYNYLTGLQCSNTTATTVTVVLNDSASSVFIVPAGGGTNIPFGAPLKSASAATALTFTPSASASTIYCSAQGFAQ